MVSGHTGPAIDRSTCCTSTICRSTRRRRSPGNPHIRCALHTQGKALAAAPGRALRVRVAPAPPATASAAATAKRLLTGVATAFMASGQVARRLGVSPRTLGKLTGNVYVVVRPPVAPPLGRARGLLL